MMKFDLHIHTNRSHDSFSSPGAIVRCALRRKLSGIALTDHGTTADDDTIRAATGRGLWIIRGNEVQTEIGDIVGLFLTGPVRSRAALSVIDEIHDQGGIAVLAHPFKYRSAYPRSVLEKIDALEVANARWTDLCAIRGNGKVDELLRTVRGRSAGSDAHFPFEVGRTCWATQPVRSPEELKQSILSGAGSAAGRSSSGWLDEASQCLKFVKRPSARQFARILYWTARRLAFLPRSGL